MPSTWNVRVSPILRLDADERSLPEVAGVCDATLDKDARALFDGRDVIDARGRDITTDLRTRLFDHAALICPSCRSLAAGAVCADRRPVRKRAVGRARVLRSD